jgi:outer membrane autotransporter protein
MKKRPSFKTENSLKILLMGLAGMGIGAYADIPSGIVGGQDNSSNPYATFVYTPDGNISVITLPTGGTLNSVAINESGTALIGGQVGGNGFAGLVNPAGGLNTLSISMPGGETYGTAINQSGNGLIGGSSSGAYAAQIAPDGTVNALTVDAGIIFAVALNDAGVGLIGGEGDGLAPYGAFVAPNGTVTPIASITGDAGEILAVAINDLGNGIVGGTQVNMSFDFAAYAAFAPAGGGTIIPLSPIPSAGSSYIQGVAINHSGLGLIGGQDEVSQAFAGYAATDGTVTPLFGTPFGGAITSVAMNSSGAGLIGGDKESNLYAAFVQPSGTVTTVLNLPIGQINSVAIDEAGVGLIGGQQGSSAYAALVAPNGALTVLAVSDNDVINSVALNNIASGTTPQSTGPYSSAIYTQLAAASALQTRFIEQNKIWNRPVGGEIAHVDISQDETNLVWNDANLASSPMPARKKQTKPAQSFKKNTFWVAPFGNYVHLKKQGSIPNYTNEIGGLLLAYDHQDANYLVGASLGYAFNYIHYSNSLGHGKVQEEMACIYGSYYRDHFRFVSILWGGLYQFSNVRHTLSIITSKAHTHGWILSPHIELATPWAIDQKKRYHVEPFLMFDWVNNWQNHYTETGSAGLNLIMGNLYNSLLQSEVGLRFYERFAYGWGDFCLEEKLSYVNQAPFDFNSATTAFVAATSSFPIAVGSSKVENLGSLQVLASFVPKNPAYPYGGFTLQTTANGSYQSYFVNLFTGIHF